jgi:hypothetical protein
VNRNFELSPSRIEGFSDYQEGDVIETFQLEKVTQEL